jgi:hypothetical protein
MFGYLYGDIEHTFSDLAPSDVCIPCVAKSFAQGFLVGAATGLLTGVALAALAAAAPAVATVAAVALAIVGVVGLVRLVASWGGMTPEQKAEALGGLVGGFAGGGMAGGLKLPMPPTYSVAPGTVAAVEAVASTIYVPPVVVGAVGAGLGTGAAMMVGGGSGGGSSGDGKKKGKTSPDGPTEPSLEPDPSRKPEGDGETLKDTTSQIAKNTHDGQMEAGRVFAQKGFKTKQIDDSAPPGTADLEIEGKPVDVKTPQGNNPKTITDTIIKSSTDFKEKGNQSDRVVVNLRNSNATPEQIANSLEASDTNPMEAERATPNVKEVFVITKDKELMRIWPKDQQKSWP